MAEINLTNFPSDHEIFLWHLDESILKLEQIFNKECSAENALYLPKFPKRRMEVMAELILLNRHGYEGLKHDKYGAPCLLDSSKQISISHCRDYVCVCLSDYPVGVDIETWGQRAWKVREKFLSKEEIVMTECEKNEKLALLLWCAKEAAFKYFREHDNILTQIRLFDLKKTQDNPLYATIKAISPQKKEIMITLSEFKEFAMAITHNTFLNKNKSTHINTL